MTKLYFFVHIDIITGLLLTSSLIQGLKYSRAVSVIGLALQLVVDHSERVAVAVVTAALHVEVERVRLAAVTVLAFHVLRADAHAWEKLIKFYQTLIL